MNRKDFLIVLAIGLAGIFQVSFAPHLEFSVKWLSWLNLIDIAVVVAALFEKRRNRMSWALALEGGIFMDIYSSRFFGFWILILLAAVAFIKLVLKKYVRFPSYW